MQSMRRKHSRHHREIFVVRDSAEQGRESHHEKLNPHTREHTQQQLNWTAWAEWKELFSRFHSVEKLLFEWRKMRRSRAEAEEQTSLPLSLKDKGRWKVSLLYK